MTHPVTSDKISTYPGVKERKTDARATGDAAQDGVDVRAENAPKTESADVFRASERLAQLAGAIRETNFASIEQARVGVANLQADIAIDPGRVLRVAANLNAGRFEAAVAEPTG